MGAFDNWHADDGCAVGHTVHSIALRPVSNTPAREAATDKTDRKGVSLLHQYQVDTRKRAGMGRISTSSQTPDWSQSTVACESGDHFGAWRLSLSVCPPTVF